MSTLPESERNPQARAVEIVSRGIAVLRDRDGVPLTDAQIEERARNIVQALIVTDLEPRPTTARAMFSQLRREFDGALARMDVLGTAIAKVAVLVVALAASVLGCGGSPPDQGGNACVLCADNAMYCGDPGRCPDGGQTLPVCGVIPGYSVAAVDCGGRTVDGLRCATQCTWVLGADASAEILDAGQITIPPGCTLPVDGVPGVCVTNCSGCW